jgi:uncharacterized protein YjlB
MMEEAKRVAEKLTGVGRPSAGEVRKLIRRREPEIFLFEGDGRTPNNPALPLVHYRDAVVLPDDFDPAAVMEELFGANGWGRGWRNGIFDFLHFHTQTHEVLGIARGEARVRFGGAKGQILTVRAGDVVVLPAGTGHQRIAPAQGLLVVGAYPPEGRYDQHKPGEVAGERARRLIAHVPVPAADPIYGTGGPLVACWRDRRD